MTINYNTVVYGIDLGEVSHALEKFKQLVVWDDDDGDPEFYDINVGGFCFYCDKHRAVLYHGSLHGVNDQHEEDVWPITAATSVWQLKCLDSAEHDALEGRLQRAATDMLGAECRSKLGIFSIVVQN